MPLWAIVNKGQLDVDAAMVANELPPMTTQVADVEERARLLLPSVDSRRGDRLKGDAALAQIDEEAKSPLDSSGLQGVCGSTRLAALMRHRAMLAGIRLSFAYCVLLCDRVMTAQ